MKSPLRDLADLIQRTAMEHPAYGQASAAVLNCVDHLSAMARNEEANREMQKFKGRLAKQLCPICGGWTPCNCDEPCVGI